MIVVPRWVSFFAIALLIAAHCAAGTDTAFAHPAPRNERGPTALQLKDGEDDDSDEPDEPDQPDESEDNSGTGSSDDSGGGDLGSDVTDDSGGDDHGSDEIDESGTDDSGLDDSDVNTGQGNDDFAQDDSIDSSDGESAPVVDDDANELTDGYRSGQAIVHLQPGAAIDDFNLRHGTTTVAGVIGSDLYLLRLPAGVTADAAMSEMATDPDTRWVELNYVNQAPEGRPGYFFVSGESTDSPGETYAPALLGNDPELQRCATGQGVTVAVLDTGIDATHPALVGRVLETGWNALDNTADVSDSGNDVDDDGDGLVDEMVGHGTHVAGIVVQIAPDVSILPVKVLGSDGVGDAFYVAAGIYYAVSQGVDVINLSLSSTYDARVVAEAVAEANEAGVVVVAAAGNGATNRVLEFPAADTGVLGIAATDQNDLKSEFSNFGDRIDLSAPGVEIVSALPGGRYATWSGTSMAAPFVAGAAALLAEENPDWVAPEISRRLTETAAALDELNPDFAGELGSGRLDVRAALACDDAGNL